MEYLRESGQRILEPGTKEEWAVEETLALPTEPCDGHPASYTVVPKKCEQLTLTAEISS